DKPIQFRKNDNVTEGKFELRLLYNNLKKLTIVLNFDFNDGGTVTYTTIDGGNDPGFNPPNSLTSILKPDFVKLLVFDGELAANLLDPERTNAQRAIEEMYQLSFFNKM